MEYELKIKHVMQKHSRGCGPAVLAMITNHEYADIIKYFSFINFDIQGIYLRTLDDYLVDNGYAIARKLKFKCRLEGKAEERVPWPLTPFADVHICEVRINKDAICNHFTVMLKDGTCLDPADIRYTKLEHYDSVLNVAGVYLVK